LIPKTRTLLIAANVVMLATIAIHDADHMRQASNWCYTIPRDVALFNVFAYLPNCIALLLSLLRQRSAALATSAASLLIAIEFAKVHLWRPTFAVWGVWNKSFFELGADARSWTILAMTVVVGMATTAAGVSVACRERRSR
jgi:hypothetical protein